MTDHDEIANLIARYCRLYDDGDGAGYADLFRHGTLTAPTGEDFASTEDVAAFHRRQCADDGSPHVRHILTNIEIDVAEGGTEASGRSYVVLYRATSDMPLQAVFVGSNVDTYHKVDGAWWFRTRRTEPHLLGDLSR